MAAIARVLARALPKTLLDIEILKQLALWQRIVDEKAFGQSS
jgi:hypothetical protein